MCNIRVALTICCLFLNTAESLIFSFIPKLVPNLDKKSLSDPTNLANEHTIDLGQVLKDGTGTLPLIGNSPGSASNSNPSDDKFFSGNFGIEIPNILKSNSQNKIDIPSPFNLGLLPSNSGQNQNFEESRTELRSSLSDFDYQAGKVPNQLSLSNGPNRPNGPPQIRQNFNNLEFYSGNVPIPKTLPNGPPSAQQLDLKEKKNNSDKILSSSSISNGPTCDPGKVPRGNEAKSLKNESPPDSPSLRFLNSEILSKGPIATLKLSGDIYLNSDSLSNNS